LAGCPALGVTASTASRSPGARLRALLAGDGIVVAPGAYDALTARLVEQAGFGAAGRRMGDQRIRTKDLIEYGMLAELLGRLPVQVQLAELGPDELYLVLTAPPDALAKEYREALALDGVELDLQESALRAVVEYAAEKRVGARALRTLLEAVLQDVLFEAPELKGRKVKIDRAYALARLGELDAGGLRE